MMLKDLKKGQIEGVAKKSNEWYVCMPKDENILKKKSLRKHIA